MKGLILAAGRGSRLGRYNQTAKCLLEVRGRRLIEYQLEACAEAGVAPVALVVGYCADDVREVVGIRAEYIQNPRWESTNSLYSFLLAREWIDGPVVVMNSDILFHPDILNRVVAAGGDAFAFDSGSGQAPEHMKVAVEGGHLVDMSKDLPLERSAGENVGLLVFSAEGARGLLDKAAAIVAAGGDKNWLGAAVRQLAAERAIRAVDIAGLPWGEIDSTFDLENVRKNVYPRIRRTTGSVRRRRRLLFGVATAVGVAAAVAGLALAFPRTRALAAAPEPSWETVAVSGGAETIIPVRGRMQTWWLLREGDVAVVEVVGPGPLRVESRLVLPTDPPDRLPYVLRIQIDRGYDLLKRTARPDAGLALERRPLARRKRNLVDLGPGKHRVAVSLLGADQVLVRVRQPDEPDTLDEDQDEDDGTRAASR
ncbi:MAG TPA: phosphocholine cytidylyltransferase family protein [Kofleriaceae bacterium]|nr:phosphocholine cytidylyltransferase family protein [Kofleriaceae bacterium]